MKAKGNEEDCLPFVQFFGLESLCARFSAHDQCDDVKHTFHEEGCSGEHPENGGGCKGAGQNNHGADQGDRGVDRGPEPFFVFLTEHIHSELNLADAGH